MAKQNLYLPDLTNNIVTSSMGTNDATVLERRNNIFSTASYVLFSINKPSLAIDLAENLGQINIQSAGGTPLST
jgi:hypothetical protein